MGSHRVGHDWSDLAAAATGSLGAKETVGREELNIWSPCPWRLLNILHPIPHACDFSDQALSFLVNSLELGNKYLLNTAEANETNKTPWDFPGGLVVKNPPANTGDAYSIPGPWRFHMPLGNWIHVWWQLSLCSRGPEPQLLSPWATIPEVLDPRACAPQQEKPQQWEPHALQIETSPPLPATRERPSTATNKINKYIKRSTVISTTKYKCIKFLSVLLLGPILSQFSWKNLEFRIQKSHTCSFYLPDLMVYTGSLVNPTPFIINFCCPLNMPKQIPT